MTAERRSLLARVYGLYALSGLVSLGYQVAWFRIFVDRFGSTQLTFALVLGNFIAGLGVGALLSRRVQALAAARFGVRDPLRLYGFVELGVAAAALGTLALRAAPAAGFGYVVEGGLHEPPLAASALRVLAAAACVFVPCVLMGVTFPLLCRGFAERARFPSSLYAWNTLGACTGVLASELLLLPTLGHDRSFVLMMGLNAAIGLAFVLRRGARTEAAPAPATAPPATPAPVVVSTLLFCAVVSGLATGVVEADVVRRLRFSGFRSEAALALVSFWAILAIFAASVAVRALPGLSLRTIQGAWLLAAGLHVATWWGAFAFEDAVVRGLTDPGAFELAADMPDYLRVLYAQHSGPLPLLAYLGVGVFPVLFLLSLLLPFACNRLQAAGHHLNRVYGLNTLAFCAGVVGMSFGAPRVDVFYAIGLGMALVAACAAALLAVRERRPVRVGSWALLGVLLAGACALTPAGFDADFFRPGDPAAQHPVSELRSDGDTTTFVVDTPEARHLYFDSFSMSATELGAQRYMRLMAHFPLLAHPDPESALLVCFGVGNTASAIASHRSIERIDVVDINHQVFRTAPAFAAWNRSVHEDPRTRLVHDDGRRFLDASDRRYDLVTSEPPPPRHEGIYRLYSQEYYRAVREHLTPQGLMTQWLTVRQMPAGAVDLAIRTFLSVFPHALLIVGSQYDFILVGSPSPIDLDRIARRLADEPRVRGDLAQIGIRDPVSLLARVVQSDAELRQRYGTAPVLSDQRNDWAYVFFDPERPPRVAYDPPRLVAELEGAGLQQVEALRRVTDDLVLLRSHVQDFPLDTLASVRETAPEHPGAGVDWTTVQRLNQEALRLEASDPEAAVARYERSLALAGGQLPVLISLARLHARRGDASAVAEAWRRYLQMEPNSGYALLQLAETELWAGRPRAAEAALERAVRLAPGDVRARRLLERARAGGRTDAPHPAPPPEP